MKVLLLSFVMTFCLFAQTLQVFQNLEEATNRIPNLKNKPHMKLIRDNSFFQPDIMIFKDLETKNEVWSLSREECKDIASTEKRCAWSCNGQYIGLMGDMAYYDYNEEQVITKFWGSHISNADGSKRRRLWSNFDGIYFTPTTKFSNWDQKKGNVIYYTKMDNLMKITIGETDKENKAEIVYKFNNTAPREIMDFSDDNYMCIEQQAISPMMYIFNLNKTSKDKGFCLTRPLEGVTHSGGTSFNRAKHIISGGYDDYTGHSVKSFSFKFDDYAMQDAPPATNSYPGLSVNHGGSGPPDGRRGFSGTYNKVWGIYLQRAGKAPIKMAETQDGHATWCGHDPEWFFYCAGEGDHKVKDLHLERRLSAFNYDGKTIKVICTPFDRRRGDGFDYDGIPRPHQSPDATKSWFHSSMLNRSDKMTASYIAVFRKPYPPDSLTAKLSGKDVEISWVPNKLSYEVKGYHVYASRDEGKTYAEITDTAVTGNSFKDKDAKQGKTYIYFVTAEEWSGLESDKSSKAIKVEVTEKEAKVIEPPKEEKKPGAVKETKKQEVSSSISGWDKTPPAKITNFKVMLDKDGYQVLNWDKSPAKDLRYYNIYASAAEKPKVCQERLIVSPPKSETNYIDWMAGKDKAYHYAIIAIDRQGNESEPVYSE
ncbi:MAG: hypothetical protein A2231_02810 [Candidatus Firestonebacteria bacterium RIFOXYA2_FULL_40_8]|nr:MAG: hypothetical protein A2231_02810 [Candidatus Firestonebacteria bacterium RIFOXYA2_FULL_40_8]